MPYPPLDIGRFHEQPESREQVAQEHAKQLIKVTIVKNVNKCFLCSQEYVN